MSDRTMIPVFSNSLGREESGAVAEVFESRWLTRGPLCAQFETEFAADRGVESVLLFNSCTSAIFATVSAVGLAEGDEVIVPSIQFHGVANAIAACGARPVFADVDPHTLNICPEEIDRLRTARTRAIYLLHYGGHPAPMADVLDAADGLLVLEDAANAVASAWRGQACGTIGDAGAWSFDAMKILVAGDGGALWMRDEQARRAAAVYRYLGMPPDRMTGTEVAAGGNTRWWEIDVERPSGRHIANDITASMALAQLPKVPGFIHRRREVWEHYQTHLAGVGDLVLPPEPLPDCASSYYLYWVATARRDALATHLYQDGIYTTFRYHPLHQLPLYGGDERLPAAELAAARTLCLPLHQNLSADDVDHVVRSIGRFFRKPRPQTSGGAR